MRIRTALTGLALGAASLFLVAPVAFASDAASVAPAPTSSPATAPPLPSGPISTTVRPVTTAPPRPVVVRPRGAAETGGGMDTEPTQGSGVFLVGGAALLAAGGVGVVGYRRFRRQS